MYKFIIGNVRITVIDDGIIRSKAIQAARQAILTANNQNKSLSHIELNLAGDEIEVNTTERAGGKTLRKSLKQSMLDAMTATLKEKLNPSDTYAVRDTWYDDDTGQEWHGVEVSDIREELLNQFGEWADSMRC